jgi:hypothetical protein
MNSSQLDALLEFLSSDKPYIRQSPEEFRLNRNIITEASRNNKKEFLEAVKLDGYALRNASSLLRSDRDVVMAAVCNKGLSLLFSNLRNDKKIVLLALNNDCYAIKFASSNLRQNVNFIHQAYNINSNIIKYIDKELINQHKDLQKLLEEFESKKDIKSHSTK